MKALAVLAFALMLAGCGGESQQEKPPEVSALVKTANATLGGSREDVAVYGAAEPSPGSERSVLVPSEAIIASVDAPSGTHVRGGQAIATLRPSPASQIEAMKANGDASAASAAYQRALRLRKDGLASDADVETARATMVATRAAVTVNRVGASGLVLRAPTAGVVEGLTVKPGDQVAAGTRIASVAVRADVRARFGVDPSMAQRIRVGDPIAVSLIAGGAPIRSVVDGVDPQIDPTTRLASVYARLPASAAVAPGQPLRGTVTVSSRPDGIMIPYSALLDDGGRSYVFVVQNGVAKRRDVSPGNSSGGAIQILSGLKAGERVVTEGATALEDGMKVREDDPAAPVTGSNG